MAQEGKYSNRYGDEYTFTVAENGVDVLWEGEFRHCRLGWPNVYKEAYEAYRKDGGDMHIEEFKKAVHEYDYEKSEYTPLSKQYSKLVYSDTKNISMVDPSGGPYLAKGMKFRYIEGHERTILGFESVDEHTWKIILDDLKWLEDRNIIGGII